MHSIGGGISIGITGAAKRAQRVRTSTTPTQNFAVLRILGIDRVWANTTTVKQSTLGQALLYSTTTPKKKLD